MPPPPSTVKASGPPQPQTKEALGRGIAKRRGRREKGPEVLRPFSCGGIGDSLREKEGGPDGLGGGGGGLRGKRQERLWWRAGEKGLDRKGEGGGEKVGKGIEKKAFCG